VNIQISNLIKRDLHTTQLIHKWHILSLEGIPIWSTANISRTPPAFSITQKKQNQSALFAKRKEYEHKMRIAQKG
jgi:hypothetical protein